TGAALAAPLAAGGVALAPGRARVVLAAVSRGPLDPLVGERDAGGGDEPADDAAVGRGRDRRGALRPPLPRAAERIPADEHADGRAALRAGRRVRGPHRQRDGLRP